MTNTPLATTHRQDRYQPANLPAAVRAIHRTNTWKLIMAKAYLDGRAVAPMRTWVSQAGFQHIDDGHDGRIFELAASLEHLAACGINSHSIEVLRGHHLTDREALLIAASGMDPTEAGAYARDPDTTVLPHLEVLAGLAGHDLADQD